ncbi:MAG: hypothetical protein M3161_01920, partial [Actinomycetota bacterium]|nr:hypothetical protein [Actinomycetota bacterium]
AVLRARTQVVDTALRRLLGELIDGHEVRSAASLAERVVAAARPEGHPLFAAEAALEIPGEPHLALWRHATCLREHRGDGHVAALAAAGIDGCEAHVLMTDVKGVPADMQREFRGWSEEEWNDAIGRLKARGLHDGKTLTEDGRTLYAEIERVTDERAAEPWTALNDEEIARFQSDMRVLVDAIVNEGLPYPNPMGLPRPEVAAPRG